MKRLFLAAIAVLASASFATAQTQRVPTAIDPGGRPENSQPAAIMIAPAGGVSGPGTVVAPDHPLPVTGTFTLPAGGATAAKQDTGNTSLGSIDTKLSSQATAAKQDTANTWLSNIQTNTTGISTAAKQDTGNTSLGSIDTKLSSQATAAAQATGNASLGSIDTKLSSQATAAKQDTGNTSLGSIDTKLSSQATAANQTTANGSLATIATNTTGVSTAANQTTANGTLSAISGKLPAALGQTTKSASMSVTMASDQTQASSTDISGTVTTGGTYQTIAALNTTRKGCLVQNPTTATEGMSVRQGGAIVWTLNPGGTFSCNMSGVVVTDLIEVTAPTTGHAFAGAKQ